MNFAGMLAAAGLVAAESHAGAGGEGDAVAFGISDCAFGEADCFAALYDAAFGREAIFPDRLEEIDFEFESGEGLVVGECGSVGESHGGIGDVAQDAAVKSAHGIGVIVARFEGQQGFARANFFEAETNQLRDWRRGNFTAYPSFQLLQFFAHDALPFCAGKRDAHSCGVCWVRLFSTGEDSGMIVRW